MTDRLPNPDVLLRAASFAILAAIGASGLLAVVGEIDLIDHLSWAPPCVIRAWTGHACPGCGMTRALVLIGQLEFSASVSAHPAAPGLVVALALGAARPRLLIGRYRDAVAGAALVFVCAAWVVRSVL